MFDLYTTQAGRVYLAATHGSAELAISLAEEACRMTGFALVKSDAGAVMFRLVHGEVCVYGGGGALTPAIKSPRKAVVL